MFVLTVALALSQTPRTIPPPWLNPFSRAYQDCLFKVIDRRYEARRFSEERALSQCATTRRAQMRAAKAALADMRAAQDGEDLILRELARLDDMVWTIIGHVRARHGGRHSGS